MANSNAQSAAGSTRNVKQKRDMITDIMIWEEVTTMFRRKQPQEKIFASYNWWDKGCLLNLITTDRTDYIESRIDRVFGKQALAEQEILEVGCGGGLLCQELAKRKVIVFGIDPSQAALAVARKQIEEANLGQNVYYQQGYAEKLPYADGSFSAIICLDVLEHVDDLPRTIAEIARVLAPGGIFIFDTINRTWIARAVLIWLGENIPGTSLEPGIHSYKKFIKPPELRAILTQNGLHVREMTGFMPAGFSHGRLNMRPGWFMGVSYIGYAIKTIEA
jgi:2-polyprenyl-6-hydroxyphenyl methylase/3-demethylubiquinone-9 3-methyltransferase